MVSTLIYCRLVDPKSKFILILWYLNFIFSIYITNHVEPIDYLVLNKEIF
jgi:hypothetical protein